MGPLMTHGGNTAKLSKLLQGITKVDAANERDISGLSLDSRRTRPGDLFIACAGLARHGSEFITHAIRAGAIAVAYETVSSADAARPDLHARQIQETGIPVIGVAGLKRQAGVIASRFYDHPSRDLFVIGITGTNGKTSCCHFLAQALTTPDQSCGVIGTLGYGVYGALQAGEHTTPDAVTLQSLLAGLRDMGVQNVVMEVSSHGLDQGRVAGTAFDAAIFTNLSHDHLDYHGDVSSYALAKQQLFEIPHLQFAVINNDDEYGRRIIDALSADVKLLTYALTEQRSDTDLSGGRQHKAHSSQVTGTILHLDNSGLDMHVTTPWGGCDIHSPLLGRFNASNLLATLSMLLLMEVPLDVAVNKLEQIRTIPGRMEYFRGDQGQPLVVVDYAHSPDALKQVLRTLREHCEGQLWCVFGCGGDRDKSKRPLMGAIAEQYADHIVVTDDNPRFEDAGQIIAHILAGMVTRDAVNILHDRGEAIAYAVRHAASGDIVLIAGKGHEEYQLVGDQKLSFSDRYQVSNLLKEVA